MDNFTRPLPDLSPVAGMSVEVQFDGGSLSSDAGVPVLRQIGERLGIANRLASCIGDPRNPDFITYCLDGMIRFRLIIIGLNYSKTDTDRIIGNISKSGGRPAASRPSFYFQLFLRTADAAPMVLAPLFEMLQSLKKNFQDPANY